MRRFKSVESSNISQVYYHREQKQLYVEFNSGSMYTYDNVSYYRYRQLMQAESKGQYFSKFIRNKYPYRKVEE